MNNSFTFWENMKEVIDVYDDIEKKYRMYDALTEYGLFGTWPEDDGTQESKDLIAFVQSMSPSLDKSSNHQKKVAESGSIGGRKQKVSDEQIEEAIKRAALKKKDIPTRKEVVDLLFELENIKVDTKTISRRYPDDKKKEIALSVLKGHRDKIDVSEGQVMSQGQNRDISYVPGTLGQNGDKIDVSDVSSNTMNIIGGFDF